MCWCCLIWYGMVWLLIWNSMVAYYGSVEAAGIMWVGRYVTCLYWPVTLPCQHTEASSPSFAKQFNSYIFVIFISY